jgi:hypothetical protein
MFCDKWLRPLGGSDREREATIDKDGQPFDSGKIAILSFLFFWDTFTRRSGNRAILALLLR